MSDVLRRKLGASRPPKKPSAVSVEALLRKTMPRDADAVLSLDLLVKEFTALSFDKAELIEGIAPTDLIYLLEAEDGARGLAILDAELVSALIEVQVSGAVSERSAGDRRPTRTDGIVAGEVVDRWLSSATTAMHEAGLEAGWPLNDFAREPGILSLREVGLLLEPVEFRVVDIALLLGGGAKTGRLRLAAPRRLQLIEGRETTTAARVRRHLPALPVELRAVIARLPLGMMKASGLEADQVLPLPDGCLDHVRLETSAGLLIREARLGQLDGHKAVRLFDPAVPVPMRGSGPALTSPAGAGGLSDLPGAAGDGAIDQPDPGLPDLPEVPASSEVADHPDLPDLPDLPGGGDCRTFRAYLICPNCLDVMSVRAHRPVNGCERVSHPPLHHHSSH